VDEAARAELGRRANTVELLDEAITYHVGYDVDAMKSVLRRRTKADAKPIATIRGLVVDSGTGRPISGAIVSTSDAPAENRIRRLVFRRNSCIIDSSIQE
jgi:hypothetical protein